MKIIPIIYGKSTLPEDMVFENGSKERTRPIDFIVYLIKTEGRLILVDAGCDTMPGFVMTDFIGPVEALARHGVKALDITDVIITHSHHDHIEGVKHFKNATVHIQKDEYENGRKYIPSYLKIKPFDESVTVAKGITALKIGGHSVGSCIVEISAEKHYVIVGDECYALECLEKKIPTGSSFCPKKSREFVEKYSDKQYVPLLCHEYPSLDL